MVLSYRLPRKVAEIFFIGRSGLRWGSLTKSIRLPNRGPDEGKAFGFGDG